MVTGPLRLFLSYAHEDAATAAELRKHLAPLRHDGIITDWYDRDLVAGSDWDDTIRTELERAHLVVVLLSADFLASDYAYGVELTRALELHRGRRLTVVPVVVRNCAWRTLPLRALQALPDGARPIDSWPRREDALVSVVSGIEAAARALLLASDDLINDWLTSRLLRRKVIREVQQRLADRGFYHGPVDGEPGPLTEQALFLLQTTSGLAVDRKVGPEVIGNLTSETDDHADGS